MVKNLPASSEDTGDPWSGIKIPQVAGQPSPCTQNPRSAIRKPTTVRSPLTARRNWPRSPQPEKACRQRQRPSTANNKHYIPWLSGAYPRNARYFQHIKILCINKSSKHLIVTVNGKRILMIKTLNTKVKSFSYEKPHSACLQVSEWAFPWDQK